MFLLIAWTMWKERNNVTFERGSVRNTTTLFQAVVTEAEDWVAADFRTLAAPVAIWSQNLGYM
jgi:hypothetical protein